MEKDHQEAETSQEKVQEDREESNTEKLFRALRLVEDVAFNLSADGREAMSYDIAVGTGVAAGALAAAADIISNVLDGGV